MPAQTRIQGQFKCSSKPGDSLIALAERSRRDSSGDAGHQKRNSSRKNSRPIQADDLTQLQEEQAQHAVRV